jgi:hypothetical protein
MNVPLSGGDSYSSGEARKVLKRIEAKGGEEVMNGPIRALVIATVAVTSPLAWPDSAIACTCQPPLPTPIAAAESPIVAAEYRQWLAGFDGVVFRGTVVSAEAAGINRKVTFRVERVWKGVSTAELVVYNDGLCPIAFVVRKSYLIAAAPTERPITTTCAAGFFKTRNEAAFLAALGQGSPPAQ